MSKEYAYDEDSQMVPFITSKAEFMREQDEMALGDDVSRELWERSDRVMLDPAVVTAYINAQVMFFSARRALRKAIKEAREAK